jgi:hypothetical protein
MTFTNMVLRAGLAVTLAASGIDHAYLYSDGYRSISVVGFGFLAQASVFCAIALLIAVGGPEWLVWAAGVMALGALGAFVMSRTVGLFGFVEQGWEPAPHPAISVVTEAATVALCVAWVVRRRKRPGEAAAPISPHAAVR